MPTLVSKSLSSLPVGPVNGRPVRLAPCRPGASPTTSSRAVTGPNEGTGALCQLGCFSRHAWRNATRRGQSGQSRPTAPTALGPVIVFTSQATTALFSTTSALCAVGAFPKLLFERTPEIGAYESLISRIAVLLHTRSARLPLWSRAMWKERFSFSWH